MTCDLSPVAEKEPAVEGVRRSVFRRREQHVPGPRGSAMLGWFEEQREAKAVGGESGGDEVGMGGQGQVA